MSVDELVKIGDLVRLDQDDSRILGLCIGLSKDKKLHCMHYFLAKNNIKGAQ